MSIRTVQRIVQAQPAVEGAGVRLRRAFGFGDTGAHDPFLLLDDFRNERPGDYLAGFPWHPHRGIETITYVLAGDVEHGDSLGNRGHIGAGDLQWMTAGRGILHQEMPKGDADGRMHGFQLWANLPSSLKMSEPRYQDIRSEEIPEVTDDDGTRVRVLCGDFWGRRGPADGVASDPRYLDVSVPHDEADSRIESSLAAGGTLVSDKRARAFWVLADAEGHELEVFKGARRLLADAGPCLLFECERRHRRSGSVEEVFAYLQSLGYQGYFIDQNGCRDLGQFDPEVHQQSSGAPGYVNNFLFLKPSGPVSGAGA